MTSRRQDQEAKWQGLVERGQEEVKRQEARRQENLFRGSGDTHPSREISDDGSSSE